MDIVSISAIALGLIAGLIAVVGNFYLPIRRVEHFETVTKVKARELKREMRTAYK